MRENTYIYKQTEDYTCYIVEADEIVFLHFNSDKMTPSILRDITAEFRGILDHFSDLGHELIFSTVANPKVLKLCYKVGTPYDVRKINHMDEKYWVVAWETGLEV